MTEQHQECNCHECTQVRYRNSFQFQIDQAANRLAQPQPAGTSPGFDSIVEQLGDAITDKQIALLSDAVRRNVQSLTRELALKAELAALKQSHDESVAIFTSLKLDFPKLFWRDFPSIGEQIDEALAGAAKLEAKDSGAKEKEAVK